MAFFVVEISTEDADLIAQELANERGYQFYIAYDSQDDAIKVKINNGTWSPPFGHLRKDLSHG